MTTPDPSNRSTPSASEEKGKSADALPKESPAGEFAGNDHPLPGEYPRSDGDPSDKSKSISKDPTSRKIIPRKDNE